MARVISTEEMISSFGCNSLTLHSVSSNLLSIIGLGVKNKQAGKGSPLSCNLASSGIRGMSMGASGGHHMQCNGILGCRKARGR